VLIYAGIAHFEQFTSRNLGVSHLTHFAGFIVAALYMRIRMGVHPIKVWLKAYK
jgi:membrane associated rhomboid family serine protease